VGEVMQRAEENIDIKDQCFFLQENGFGKASEFIENILQQILKCQETKALEFPSLNLYVIIIGISVLGICIVLVIPFVLFIQNRLNLLWNLIKKVSIKNSNNLGNLCVSRLKKFHFINNLDIGELKISKVPIRFNYIKRYGLVLIIFVVIGSIYYIISSYAFYKKINLLIVSRPKLLNNILISRISLTKLDFYAKTINFNGFLDFQTLYPEYVPINNDYKSCYIDSVNNLIYNSKALLNPDYLELIGPSLFQSYFVGQSNNQTNLMCLDNKTKIFLGM
jgi:hypothetical protein